MRLVDVLSRVDGKQIRQLHSSQSVIHGVKQQLFLNGTVWCPAMSGEHEVAALRVPLLCVCVCVWTRPRRGHAHTSDTCGVMETPPPGGGRRRSLLCLFICQQSNRMMNAVSAVHNKSTECETGSLAGFQIAHFSWDTSIQRTSSQHTY